MPLLSLFNLRRYVVTFVKYFVSDFDCFFRKLKMKDETEKNEEITNGKQVKTTVLAISSKRIVVNKLLIQVLHPSSQDLIRR